jgi:hypothetical protein
LSSPVIASPIWPIAPAPAPANVPAVLKVAVKKVPNPWPKVLPILDIDDWPSALSSFQLFWSYGPLIYSDSPPI